MREDFTRLRSVTTNRKNELIGEQLAVVTDSRSVSTGPGRMFSVLTEGYHMNYSREFGLLYLRTVEYDHCNSLWLLRCMIVDNIRYSCIVITATWVDILIWKFLERIRCGCLHEWYINRFPFPIGDGFLTNARGNTRHSKKYSTFVWFHRVVRYGWTNRQIIPG